MPLRRTLSLFLLGLASSAVAQTHFCIAGDLDRLDASQVAECQAKMTSVRDAVRRRGAPSGWHFVVVCDETGWSDYANFIAPSAGPLGDAAFHTDGSLHWTFVRGSQMDANSSGAADTLLAIALKGVPNPRVAPHTLPNPRRVLREPATLMARSEPPALPSPDRPGSAAAAQSRLRPGS